MRIEVRRIELELGTAGDKVDDSLIVVLSVLIQKMTMICYVGSNPCVPGQNEIMIQ